MGKTMERKGSLQDFHIMFDVALHQLPLQDCLKNHLLWCVGIEEPGVLPTTPSDSEVVLSSGVHNIHLKDVIIFICYKLEQHFLK